jgi:hypothetical protein
VDEGNSRSLRSGRDDNSVWALRVCYGEFGRAEGRTADPSASLGMTKGTAAPSVEIGLWMRGTAGPSAPLRSGRDDNSVWVLRVCYGEFGRAEGRTADPSASLGMTKGRAAPSVEVGLWRRGTAGPCRDDSSVWVLRVCYGEFGRAEGRTADPSVSLGMTKGRARN